MKRADCPDRTALSERRRWSPGVSLDGDAAYPSDAELVRLQRSAMEEALYETTILRQFAGLSLERIPDETTILNFRRLLRNMNWQPASSV